MCEAVGRLRRGSLEISPRRQRASGRLTEPAHRPELGRALCVWGGRRLGKLARDGKHHDDRVGDELLDACVTLVRAWRPRRAPEWVTAVPSHRRPHLVGDFARRLAVELLLPFREAVERDRLPPRKTMAEFSFCARPLAARSLAPTKRCTTTKPTHS